MKVFSRVGCHKRQEVRKCRFGRNLIHRNVLQQILIAMFAIQQTQQLILGQNKYILELPPIGKGSYGEVFKCWDETNRQIIALKKQDLKKAIEEANVLKNLKHDAIITYLDSFFSEELQEGYIMMEYFEGRTLNEMISFFRSKVEKKKMGLVGLPEKIVIQIFSELLEGFRYMHEKGITHCDIKPQNIMVNHQGMVKIIDLGLASEDTHSTLGTPLYIAPQCIEQQVDKPSGSRDVWSLGLVLYEMLIGKPCYNQLVSPKRSKQTNEQFKKRILSHIKKQGLVIKYNEYYNPFWESITSEMLKYQAQERPTMKKIAIEMKLNMLNSQIDHDESYRNLFRTDLLTQNYYQQHSMTPENILRSETILNKVIIYLKFFHHKYKFLPKYCELLAHYEQKARFPFITNINKYCLIFLALSLYLRSIKQLLNRLTHNKLRIDFQHENISKNVEEGYFSQRDLQRIHRIYEQYRKFYKNQFDFYQAKLLNKIIPKIKEGLSQHNALHHKLQNKMRNLLDDVSDYEQIYRERIIELFSDFKQKCKIGNKKVLKYSYPSDLVIHYLTIIISKFDVFFENSQIACLAEISQLYSTLSGTRDDEQSRKYLQEHIQKEGS